MLQASKYVSHAARTNVGARQLRFAPLQKRRDVIPANKRIPEKTRQRKNLARFLQILYPEDRSGENRHCYR
jgi:hypothetical protein